MREPLREVLFGGEPRRGAFWWLLVLAGCLELAYGLFFPLPPQIRLNIIPLGLMMLFMGTAELLPVGRRNLAVVLRIGGLVALMFVVAVVVGSRIFA